MMAMRAGRGTDIGKVNGRAGINSWGSVKNTMRWKDFIRSAIVSRVLGMGDLMSLIERVEQRWTKKLPRTRAQAAQGRITLEDFRDQLKQISKDGARWKRSWTCCRR